MRKRLPNHRRVNDHAHPSLVEAVAVSRFWRSVDIRTPEECWLWNGSLTRGYGEFYYNGKLRAAHELALSFSTGEVRPDNFDTCHSCDNPRCVNPHHLRFDSRQGNIDDMHNRGRAALGEARSSAKLTDAMVLEIRARRANGALQQELADQYGVSASNISEIVNGLAWTHVGGPIGGRSKRTVRSPRSRNYRKEAA